MLGRSIKDVDVEVHGMSLERLESCLQNFGNVALVGKKFGVLRLESLDVDWSLPRKAGPTYPVWTWKFAMREEQA